jgi:hypothetical protein
MWFADGLSRKGLNYHGVALDGSGGVMRDMVNGSSSRQRLHEDTHIVQFQGGADPRPEKIEKDEQIKVGPVDQWNAIPYKQLFSCCQGADGKVALDGKGKAGWCYPANNGTVLLADFDVRFQQPAEKDMWDPGAGIWQHNPAELSKFDTPVTLWQKRR